MINSTEKGNAYNHSLINDVMLFLCVYHKIMQQLRLNTHKINGLINNSVTLLNQFLASVNLCAFAMKIEKST